MKRLRENKLFITLVLLAILFAITGFSRLFERQKQSQFIKERVQELKENKEEKITSNEEELIEDVLNQKTFLPEYQGIYEENNELVGWLFIEGTSIDYPVMQRPGDEDYYLSHDFDHNENVNGSLILDLANNVDNEDTNLIIHGHNMKSGDMFGRLKLFTKQEYLEERSIISFDTIYEKRIYEIIAVIKSQVYTESDDVFKYYKFTNPSDEQEFNEFKDYIREENLIYSNKDISYGDQFLTLSTCSSHTENGRLVVIAKAIN